MKATVTLIICTDVENSMITALTIQSLSPCRRNLVKGYKQWEKEFDRHVKPGEKAIKILAPSPFTVKKQVEKIDPDTQKPVFDKLIGKPVTEEKEIKIPAFR